jgi:hypothetical protein
MPVCGTGTPGGEPPAAGERPMATQAEFGVPGVALDIEDHAVVALEAVDAAKSAPAGDGPRHHRVLPAVLVGTHVEHVHRPTGLGLTVRSHG